MAVKKILVVTHYIKMAVIEMEEPKAGFEDGVDELKEADMINKAEAATEEAPLEWEMSDYYAQAEAGDFIGFTHNDVPFKGDAFYDRG